MKMYRVGGVHRPYLRQGTQSKVGSITNRWQLVLIRPSRGLNPFSRVRRLECLPLDHLGGQKYNVSSLKCIKNNIRKTAINYKPNTS